MRFRRDASVVSLYRCILALLRAFLIRDRHSYQGKCSTWNNLRNVRLNESLTGMGVMFHALDS